MGFLMNAKEQLYENKNPSFQASKTVKKIYGRMWLFIINPFSLSLACVEESIPVYSAFCYVSWILISKQRYTEGEKYLAYLSVLYSDE